MYCVKLAVAKPTLANCGVRRANIGFNVRSVKCFQLLLVAWNVAWVFVIALKCILSARFAWCGGVQRQMKKAAAVDSLGAT